MPYYEITVSAFRNVIVEAEDLDMAMEEAMSQCNSHDWEITEFECLDEDELTAEDAKRCLESGSIMLEGW